MLRFAQEGNVMGRLGKARKRAAWERAIYDNLTMISGVPGGKPRRRHRQHRQSTHEKKGINPASRGHSSSTTSSFSGFSYYSRSW